jgi:hypothetical protein
MITIMKYFLDFYVELIKYAEEKGLGGENGIEYDEHFLGAFLMLFIGTMFIGLTIVTGLIAALAPAANGLFVVLAVIFCVIAVIFYIFMFAKFVEGFNWG